MLLQAKKAQIEEKLGIKLVISKKGLFGNLGRWGGF